MSCCQGPHQKSAPRCNRGLAEKEADVGTAGGLTLRGQSLAQVPEANLQIAAVLPGSTFGGKRGHDWAARPLGAHLREAVAEAPGPSKAKRSEPTLAERGDASVS